MGLTMRKQLALCCLLLALGMSGANMNEEIVRVGAEENELSALAEDEVTSNEYRNFVKKHTKRYSHEEWTRRLPIFAESLRFVREWNSKPHTFKVAINEFADLTGDEFASRYLSKNLEASDVLTTRTVSL